MSLIIFLSLATPALIVATGAHRPPHQDVLYRQKLDDELFRKLDKSRLKTNAVEKMLLEVEEPNEAKIGEVSVEQILSYRDGSCNLERLGDPRLMNPYVGIRFNSGVKTFLDTYLPKRIKNCSKQFFSILDAIIEAIPASDREIFRELKHYRKRTILGVTRYFDCAELEHLAERSKKNWKQDKRFPKCVQLIQKLSAPMSFDGWTRPKQSDGKLRFFNRWYNTLEACKTYTEKQCEPYYTRYDPESGDARLPIPLEPNDDLKAQCRAIVDIGLSEKTKRRQKAERTAAKRRLRGKSGARNFY